MPSIFLSFSREDEKLASYLYKLLADIVGPNEVFKANEPSGIRVEDWRERIRSELSTCRVLVGLATSRSIDQKWLWIESGAVWARAADKVVILATPGIPIPALVPYDQIQIPSLESSRQDLVKDAIRRIVSQSGGTSAWRWTPAREEHLSSLFAEAATYATANPTGGAGRTADERDLATLGSLLKTMPTAILDQHLDLIAQDRLNWDVFYFWESFRSAVEATSFHVFDTTLSRLVNDFYLAWKGTLSFGARFFSDDGQEYRFLGPQPGNSDRWEKDHDRFLEAGRRFYSAYNALMKHVKSHFGLSFDLAEISAAALRQYRDYMERWEPERTSEEE